MDYSPDGDFWTENEANIPIGSVWLQPTSGVRAEGLFYKNSSGIIKRVEARIEQATDTDVNNSITLGQSISLNPWNFFFKLNDNTHPPEPEYANRGDNVNFPFVMLKSNNGVSMKYWLCRRNSP